MVTVLVVVLPIQSGTAPFWAGVSGASLAKQHKGIDGVLGLDPGHVKVVSVRSKVVVTVSVGDVVVVVVAPSPTVSVRVV